MGESASVPSFFGHHLVYESNLLVAGHIGQAFVLCGGTEVSR